MKLISKTVSYEETMKAENREATLSGFLEEIALIADIDSVDENQDYVVLMTLHSAKGLEFPYVYLAGMEDGMFPSSMCIFPVPVGAGRGAQALLCGNHQSHERTDYDQCAAAYGAWGNAV